MTPDRTVLDEYTPLQVERGRMGVSGIYHILRTCDEVFVMARANLGAVLPEDDGQRASMLSPARVIDDRGGMRLSFEDPDEGMSNTKLVDGWVQRTRSRIVIVVPKIAGYEAEPEPEPTPPASQTISSPYSRRPNYFAIAAAELEERLRDAETGEKREKVEKLARWFVDNKFAVSSVDDHSIQLYRKTTETMSEVLRGHIRDALRGLGMRRSDNLYRSEDAELWVALFMQIMNKCIDEKTKKSLPNSLEAINRRLVALEAGDWSAFCTLQNHRVEYRERAVYFTIKLFIPS